MDPIACVIAFLGALLDSDADLAADCTDAYEGWVDNGGFLAGVVLTWGQPGDGWEVARLYNRDQTLSVRRWDDEIETRLYRTVRPSELYSVGGIQVGAATR